MVLKPHTECISIFRRENGNPQNSIGSRFNAIFKYKYNSSDLKGLLNSLFLINTAPVPVVLCTDAPIQKEKNFISENVNFGSRSSSHTASKTN
jgi:hypothetical protein